MMPTKVPTKTPNRNPVWAPTNVPIKIPTLVSPTKVPSSNQTIPSTCGGVLGSVCIVENVETSVVVSKSMVANSKEQAKKM
jgi:hypothetical protein